MEPVLALAVAANLLACAFSVTTSLKGIRRARRDIREMQEITSHPQFTCAQKGHAFDLEVMTLDRQEPPEFVFTHTFKWTCSRCGYEDMRTMRQVMLAPDVERMTGSWLNLEGDGDE